MWQRKMEVRSLGWCNMGRRDLGTWISMSVGNPVSASEMIGLGSQVHSGIVLVDS